MNVVAGTSQYSTASTPAIVSGYGGDIGFNGSEGFAVPFVTSGLGTSSAVIVNGATLNRPDGFAVDSVGNIYIADGGNDLIREVNYQTGLINIVAGATPTTAPRRAPPLSAPIPVPRPLAARTAFSRTAPISEAASSALPWTRLATCISPTPPAEPSPLSTGAARGLQTSLTG